MSSSLPAESTWTVMRRLFDLAAPIVGLNILAVLSLAVDTAMLGRVGNSEAALTGLGFATQIAFLLMVAMIGLTVGTVAFVARAHGSGDEARVNHILGQSTTLTLLLGLLVAIFGNLLADPLISMLGGGGEAKVAALAYLRPSLTGVVFSYLTILYAAVLRGVGNTRLPFYVALVSNALNVFFNYGLILGNYGLPALGPMGAAIGTVASQAVAAISLNLLLRRGAVPGLCAPIVPRGIDVPLAKDLLRIGAPAAADMLVLNGGFLAIVGFLGRIDQLAVAAHGIGLRIQALAFVPGMSISQATGALVGQALGRGDITGAQQVVKSSLLLTTTIMSVLASIIWVGAPEIVALFEVAPDSTLGAYCITWIRLLGSCMPFVGVYISFGGVFQGSGATRINLRINLLATFLFQIPLSALLGFSAGLGAFGVWLAFPLGFVLKSILGTIAWRKGDWARTGARV